VLPVLKSDDGWRLVYWFETPCSPPLKWMERASSAWPALFFALNFMEEMLNYRGDATARAGKLTSEIDTEFGEAIKQGGTAEGDEE
jgi:hypothetical protein